MDSPPLPDKDTINKLRSMGEKFHSDSSALIEGRVGDKFLRAKGTGFLYALVVVLVFGGVFYLYKIDNDATHRSIVDKIDDILLTQKEILWKIGSPTPHER